MGVLIQNIFFDYNNREQITRLFEIIFNTTFS